MGMSTYVTGLRDANDPEHKKMAAALKACVEADLPLPKPLEEYFDGSSDPDVCLEVKIKSTKGSKKETSYIDVAVADLPPNVKVIRFCNSW